MNIIYLFIFLVIQYLVIKIEFNVMPIEIFILKNLKIIKFVKSNFDYVWIEFKNLDNNTNIIELMLKYIKNMKQ